MVKRKKGAGWKKETKDKTEEQWKKKKDKREEKK